MLKCFYILCLLSLFCAECFSQTDHPVLKNEISLGINNNGHDYLPSDLYSIAYKRTIKKTKLLGKFNCKYYSGKTTISSSDAGGELGLTRNACVFKNKKWLIFYGAEFIFLYMESNHEKYNTYGTYLGAGLISGFEFIICKHFSLSAQINPGYAKTKYDLFKKTNEPLIFREFSYDGMYSGFSIFFIAELNYKF